jgi:hypothetical protein
VKKVGTREACGFGLLKNDRRNPRLATIWCLRQRTTTNINCTGAIPKAKRATRVLAVSIHHHARGGLHDSKIVSWIRHF